MDQPPTTSSVDLSFERILARVRDLAKLGEGRQAELFVFPPGVVKLFRNMSDQPSAQFEAATMLALQQTGIPMPQLLGTVTIEGRPGIVMERLEGNDQLTLLGRKPWVIWSAATKLARLHAQIHALAAPEGLRPLKESLRFDIAASDAVPEDCKARAFALLDLLPEGNSICHWDYHPANVIETRDGPRAIDWPNVRSGPALADVARTLQILSGGSLPPGAPLLVRMLTAVGRAVLHWRYKNEYRRLRPFDDRDLAPWLVVSAASRLTHRIPEERATLLALVRS